MGANLPRRRFLASAALAAGVFPLRSVRSGPDDSVPVGLIGCGSRGPYLGYLFHDTPGAKIVALCDVNRARLDKAREFMKGLGANVTTYHDYRKLLDDKRIEAVIVATNGHWHVLPAIHACHAGKDVYLEKPVGTSIGEGRAAVAASRRTKRIIQMGTQQRTWDHYRRARDIIRSGELGEISNVHVWDVCNAYPGFGAPPDGPPPPELDWDFWLGPSPAVPYNPNRYAHHYWFFDYGGGFQVAWGAQHYDIVHWIMGVPAAVSATGSGGKFAFHNDNRQWPDTFTGTCEYPPGPVAKKGFLLTYTLRGGSDRPIEGCRNGKAFHGTNGTLVLSRSGYRIYTETRDGKKVLAERASDPPVKEHVVMQKHVRSFIDCVVSRRTPECSVEVGHRATNPGHLMNIAWRVGRQVRWDAARELVRDDPAAQALVTKRYRSPWTLPA